jgi:ABC-type phosphate/phosphonate transport system substrate-binding protein
MRRAILSTIVGLPLLATVAGCQGDFFSQTLWNPFDLKSPFAVDQKPIRIGVVSDGNGIWNIRAWWDLRDATPWTDFRVALSDATGRPVQVEQLKAFQVALQLEGGRLDFALLSDEQFAEVAEQIDRCEVVARAVVIDRVGLIVAKASSDVQSMEQVAGHRFSFGPRGDPVLHYATAAALEAAGVTVDAIQRELVPLHSLQYHLSAFESAKEIAYGTTDVGVIDQAEYESYPETGGTLIPVSFAKDQFRILGHTSPLDLGPFVAAPDADPKMTRAVRKFLLSTGDQRTCVTGSIGVASFVGVEDSQAMTGQVRR